MAFWSYFILFFFPFIGGTISTFLQKQHTSQLKLFLAFSGAFLLTLTATRLIPEVYHTLGHQAGYWVLAGFFLQIIIERFSRGIEHGHLHLHANLDRIPYSIFIALCLHAFMEGLAVGGGSFNAHLQQSLVFGIALHEIPAAFALVSLLKISKARQRSIYLWIIGYSLMVPLGAGIAEIWSLNYSGDVIKYLLAMVIGIFLHISTTILFENSENHRMGWYKIIAISLGLGVALLSGWIHVH